MLEITSIEKGIVIDHIPAGYGIKLFHLLKLEKADYTVALINNAFSKKRGKKDIIKINNTIEFDVEFLGLINADITVNIIDGGKIIKKLRLTVPERVVNIIHCKNPRCVTSVESKIDHVFHLVDPVKRSYRCEYCDDIIIPY
ncbi:MAG TPA: aspartate carbamoyltransferase regulatory subunit [Bacteroidales bacterium]|mgnify:CR=1 FL=1|nr:aspartate carbamoyltransferase regulatory subunit [Bacteroidales bacterium]HPZ03761.1 aspartate carbamoyltransferase regulatory subunit [Bacteroidales bacterium]HQB75347.1 aspartate carbamoyltransferase regulatory subunit [Bacteroidales bacterium]HQQ21707.1 aspartate carbamoyltransferase regulatory subunit [Bacteroidales bacterium]